MLQLLTFDHLETLLALVEEGSATRASARLGLGHSTVSAHVKLIEEELGDGLFSRSPSGLMATAAGLDAYQALGPIVERASFCFDSLKAGDGKAPLQIPVVLPAGAPGSLLSRALRRVQLASRRDQMQLHFIPTADAEEEPAIRIGYRAGRDGADACAALRDGWVLVQFGANVGWRAERLPLSALAGLSFTVPDLPAPLLGALAALADEAGAVIEHSDLSFHHLVGHGRRSQQFRTIVPAGLLNPALVTAEFECIHLEPGRFDPVVTIESDDFPGAAAKVKAAIATLLTDGMADGDGLETLAEPESEMLSLKHCRSFLALYEEGNVRRAAQRLCVVQPAVSMQLRKIEKQLGHALFNRAHHGIVARLEAHRLYGLVRPLVTQLDETALRLRQSTAAAVQSVRIGLMPALDEESLIAEAVSSALERWSKVHPDCALRIVEAPSRALAHEVQSGAIDFAITDRAFPSPALVFEPLVEDSMVVVVGRESGLLDPGPVPLDSVLDLPLVLPSGKHGLRGLIAQHVPHAAAIRAKVEVDSLATALSVVKIARYATILPLGAVYKSRNRRGLTIHEIREPCIAREICLAWQAGVPTNTAAMELIAELRIAFGELGSAFETATEPLLALIGDIG